MHCCSANHRHPTQIAAHGAGTVVSPPQAFVFSQYEFLSIEKSQKSHTISTIKCLPLKVKLIRKTRFKCQKSGCLAYNYGLCLNLSDISHGEYLDLSEQLNQVSYS